MTDSRKTNDEKIVPETSDEAGAAKEPNCAEVEAQKLIRCPYCGKILLVDGSPLHVVCPYCCGPDSKPPTWF